MDRIRPSSVGLAAVAGTVVGLSGCSSPLAREGEETLRRSVLDSVRREVAQAELDPSMRMTEREERVSKLDIRSDIMPQLERMSGPGSYDPSALAMSEDLTGRPQQVVRMSLEHAVRSAVENNLTVQFARLAPVITEAQTVAAEAAFDWVLFSSAQWQSVDEPDQTTSTSFSTFGASSRVREDVTGTVGLRKRLPSGASLSAQQELLYSDNRTPNVSVVPDPATRAVVTLQLDQPLLRNFGSDVSLAQVRLNRNAERDAIASLKRDLISTVTDVETAYWQLALAHRNLLIQRRLLERGEETKSKFEKRGDFDVSPALIADARARVESRRSDVLRAENALRQASDRLKALLNDPGLTVGSEVLLVPVEDVPDAPLEFSLYDSVITAIRNRPEVQQAILSIDNTSIRQEVADNARLPQLDMRLQAKFSSQDEGADKALGDEFDGQFISYLAGLFFEAPIGNRAAEASYRVRRAERQQAVIAYRNTIQQIVLQVKSELRNVVTAYRLIEQTRTARVAAAENLRTLLVLMETTEGYTPPNLDLLLRREEALALAEREEVGALTNYASSLAALYSAMGTALERNRVAFVVPDADDDSPRAPRRDWALPDGLVPPDAADPLRP